MRRWAKRIGLLVAALLAAAIAGNWTHLRAFPGVLPAFTAKEHCSCRFVMGQDEPYCERYTRQWLPISERAVDDATRRVTVRATGTTRSARWIGEREGCLLDP